jgi:hypothetical protein
MQANKVVQREIEAKWKSIPRINTTIHKADVLLPPGKWQRFDPFLLMAEDHMKKGPFQSNEKLYVSAFSFHHHEPSPHPSPKNQKPRQTQS